jgi:hypothetical protein
MCVLNGRFCKDKDNFTSVWSKGKSVVDYICVPHDCLKACENFEVISVESIIDRFKLQSLIGSRSKLPDHYMLRFTYNYKTVSIEDDKTNSLRSQFNTKIFKLKRIHEDFLTSQFTYLTSHYL